MTQVVPLQHVRLVTDLAVCHTGRMFQFGDVVRLLRNRAGWGIREFAEVSGVGVTTLTDIEAGRGNQTRNVLMRTVKPFKLPLSKVLELAEALESASVNVLGIQAAADFAYFVGMTELHDALDEIAVAVVNSSSEAGRAPKRVAQRSPGHVGRARKIHDRRKSG